MMCLSQEVKSDLYRLNNSSSLSDLVGWMRASLENLPWISLSCLIVYCSDRFIFLIPVFLDPRELPVFSWLVSLSESDASSMDWMSWCVLIVFFVDGLCWFVCWLSVWGGGVVDSSSFRLLRDLGFCLEACKICKICLTFFWPDSSWIEWVAWELLSWVWVGVSLRRGRFLVVIVGGWKGHLFGYFVVSR